MKSPRLPWYLLGTFLALVPVGARFLTWKSSQSTPVDPAMAKAGEVLFKHEWTSQDPLAPGGDGLGPVFNAASCVACHRLGGIGGAGGLDSNVTTFTVRNKGPARQGVVHARAVRFQESLQQVHAQLPPVIQPSLGHCISLSGSSDQPIAFPNGVHVSQRNTPALFGAKLIDDLPDRVILTQEKTQRLSWGLASHDSETRPIGRALRLADGRVGKFGWKGQTASLSDFVRAACANELGLGNPGQAQPTPLGKPDYRPPGLDLTLEQCDQLTAFVAALPRPVERLPADSHAREGTAEGKTLFKNVGCADCHTPDLGPVEGIYSDLLLHRMGQELQGGGSYNEPPVPVPDIDPGEGPSPGEWRTPPLWGVADSAPYLHDGRARTLEDAIRLHGGQGARAAKRFARLNATDQARLVAFLGTLRAP